MTPLFAMLALSLVVPQRTKPLPSPESIIDRLHALGRRPAESVTWDLLNAYEREPAETLKATALALIRRCDNSVTEEALQRILKQNPSAALPHLAEPKPPSLCAVRAIDALNRHPRMNAAIGAGVLLAATESADKKVRLAALDALTAPGFANDRAALDIIRTSPRLTALLDHADDETRFRGTALAVSSSGDATHPHLSKLVAFRDSRSLSTRQRVQEVLAALGRDELREDFKSITECVGAFQAIAKRTFFEATRRDREKYGEAISGATQSKNAYCRIFAYEFVGAWPEGPNVCDQAKAHLRREKVEAVRVAMRGACFERAPTAKDEKWLTEILLRSPSRFQKAIAARALLRGPRRSGRLSVFSALKSSDRDTRWIAAQSFADERTRWALLHALCAAQPTADFVKREIAEFVTTMEAVLAAIGDSDWYVRNNAALALQEATGVDFGTHRKRWTAWWESTGRTLWHRTASSGDAPTAPKQKPE